MNGGWRNWMQTVLLFGGMLLLLSTISEMIFGDGAFWWMALGAGLVMALLPRVHPRLVMRLYHARALAAHEVPELYRLTRELARRAGLNSVPQLYYIPSRAHNAFTSGDTDHAVIGITDGLLRSLSRRELVGVLAHEVGHLRNRDIWLMTLADVITQLTSMLATVGFLLLALSLPFYVLGAVEISWLAILLLIFSPTISSLLQLGLSRAREFAADAAAVALTGDPEGLARALSKIDPEQLGWLARFGLPGRRDASPSWLRTHPATAERIERLMREASQPGRQPMARPGGGPVWHGNPTVIRLPRRHWSGLWY